jgi:mannose/fructose-specific phosphotransferase system component IIA
MAISKTFTTEHGVTVEGAYIRVETVSLVKSFAQARVSIYADTAKPFIQSDQVSFLVDLKGPNPIKQAYQFLKSLPEFSDAIDC